MCTDACSEFSKDALIVTPIRSTRPSGEPSHRASVAIHVFRQPGRSAFDVTIFSAHRVRFTITVLCLVGFLSLYGCSKSKPSVQQTKTVSYRGGIVKFSLPSHWREEYGPESGGTFYEDRPDSGILRLNVITAESKSGESSEQAVEQAFPAGSFEMLPSGLPMRHRIADAEERGTPIRLHRWEIAVPVPPTRLRIVCFTHTILARQEKAATTDAELDLVEKSIRSAEFSRETGISGSLKR